MGWLESIMSLTEGPHKDRSNYTNEAANPEPSVSDVCVMLGNYR